MSENTCWVRRVRTYRQTVLTLLPRTNVPLLPRPATEGTGVDGEMQGLDVVQELQRALREAPQRSEELKSQKNTASRGEGGAASRAAASGSLYEGALGGAPAGLALHAGPTFPSIFDSLASALFSR